MIDIDSSRYAKIGRTRVLQILEHADLKPDRLTAHRNRMFTARYLRDRQPAFTNKRYEERMEIAADNTVAIFKRPNTRLDRGRYITLKFAVTAVGSLGLNPIKLKEDGTAASEASPTPAVSRTRTRTAKTKPVIVNGSASAAPKGDPMQRLNGLARDMKQLVHYAHDLVEKDDKRDHILVVLDELKKHVDTLNTTLHELNGGK